MLKKSFHCHYNSYCLCIYHSYNCLHFVIFNNLFTAMSPDIVKVGKRLTDGIPDVTPPHKKAKEQTEDIVYPNRTINMSGRYRVMH